MEIRIGARVQARECDIDPIGHTRWRTYRGIVIGVNRRRRWALVAYRVGEACLRSGFPVEDIRVLEDEDERLPED